MTMMTTLKTKTENVENNANDTEGNDDHHHPHHNHNLCTINISHIQISLVVVIFIASLSLVLTLRKALLKPQPRVAQLFSFSYPRVAKLFSSCSLANANQRCSLNFLEEEVVVPCAFTARAVTAHAITALVSRCYHSTKPIDAITAFVVVIPVRYHSAAGTRDNQAKQPQWAKILLRKCNPVKTFR